MGVKVRCFECKESLGGQGTGKQHGERTGHTWQPAYYCTECFATFTGHSLCKQHVKRGVHDGLPRLPTRTTTTRSSATSSEAAKTSSPASPSAPFYPIRTQVAVPLSGLASASPSLSSRGQNQEGALEAVLSKNGHSAHGATAESIDDCSCAFCKAKEFGERVPPSISCEKCGIRFLTLEELDDHYRKSSLHPNCRSCGLGFQGLSEWATHRAGCPPPVAPSVGEASESEGRISPQIASNSEIEQDSTAPLDDDGGNTRAEATSTEPPSTATNNDDDGTASHLSEAASITPTTATPPVTLQKHDADVSSVLRAMSIDGRQDAARPEHVEHTVRVPQVQNDPSTLKSAGWTLPTGTGSARRQGAAPAATAGNRASGPAGALSFHCRLCLRDPCVDPVATMCGHIFCHICIVQQLATRACCPVCQKLFFVRLHVEADS